MPLEIKNLSIKIKVGNSVKSSSTKNKSISHKEVIKALEQVNKQKEER